MGVFRFASIAKSVGASRETKPTYYQQMKLTAKTKTAPTKEEENVSRNELQFATKLIERSFRYAVNNAVSNLLTHPEYKAARKEIGEIESSIKNHEDAIRELIRRLGGLKDRIAEISEEMAEKYAKDV